MNSFANSLLHIVSESVQEIPTQRVTWKSADRLQLRSAPALKSTPRVERRDESAVSVEQPAALRGIIGVYQIEMITALSQLTPSAARLPSE